MAVFVFSAAKQNGEKVTGEREAENAKALAPILRKEGLLLLDARPKDAGRGGLRLSLDVGDIVSRMWPVGIVDKMFFTRNLGVMIAAGLSLPRAMDASSEESSNKKFKKIIADINASVVRGKSFAESLRSHERVFGALFINMIEVGEASGKLVLILKLLASQMKKDYTLKKRVRGAMMYPAIILLALVGVGTLMMIYVVPTLTDTILGLGGTLPLTTQIIISMSEFILHYGLWMAIAIVVLAAGVWRLTKTKQGKQVWDRGMLKMPIFGALVRKYNEARFCRTLSYLLTAGVPIVRSLEITSHVLGNVLFADAAAAAGKDIQKGTELNVILAAYPHVFQPLVHQMVAVGEESGKLSGMLLRLALFFEEEVADTTKNLSTVIEPILMIVIGVGVGLFAVSMLQPIYSSMGNL